MGKLKGDYMYLTPQKDIPTKEELDSMDSETHEQFINDYYNGVFAKSGFKPTFFAKIKYRFGTLLKLGGGLLGIVIIYGIINLVMLGGQSVLHGEDKKELNQIKIELDSGLNELNALGFQLDTQESELKSLEDQINSTEDTDAKNELIDKYNNYLPAYNADFDQYSSKLVSYNLKVDRANELSNKVGSTYYILPIPGGHK